MEDEFRRRVMGDIARLLVHWREVEFWIKRAEQVSKKAVIPAINELRYASRQLINAIRVLDKPRMSNGDKSAVKKRIIIAEQYLLNAEHDICDAIINFYDRIIHELDNTFGPSTITILFNEYPFLKERLNQCIVLIADARHEYDNRQRNYKKMREEHFPVIIESYAKLLSAEVTAKEMKEKQHRELMIIKSRIHFLEVFSFIASIIAVIMFPITFYLWAYSKTEVCAQHPGMWFVCPYVEQVKPISTNAPATGETPDVKM